MTDPIADMLTRIRNAIAIQRKTMTMPHSKVKEAIAKTLVEEEYISDYKLEKTTVGQPNLIITLKYKGGLSMINKIKRISKPGRRVYMKKKHLKPVLSGHGISIISTSQGVMTQKQALKKNLGGEMLCEVY